MMKMFFWYGVSMLFLVCLLGVGISVISSAGSSSQIHSNFAKQDTKKQTDKNPEKKKTSKKSESYPATKKTLFEKVGETLGITDTKNAVDKNVLVSEKSSTGVSSFEKPAYLIPYTSSSNFEYSQGKVTLFVTADWMDEDKTLFWGNYNDTSYQDLFVVAAHGRTVSFITYDHDEKSNTITADLGDDYHNRQFMVQIAWQMLGNGGKKQLWVNGAMKEEAVVQSFPTIQNNSVLVGLVDSIEIAAH
jgi:hypothetical protein